MQLSNTPGKLLLPFAADGTKNAIPVDSQVGIVAGKASLADGFPPLTRTPLSAGGVPPSGLDMNGILFEMSDVIRWANAGGGYAYDADFATNANVGGYPKGARVMRSDGVGYWLNTVENNETDPEDAGAAAAGWVPDYSSGASTVTMTNANVTLTPLEYGKRIIVLTGTLTSNLNLIFPSIPGAWVVLNKCTGNFAVTCKTAAGTGFAINVGSYQFVSGDGVNVYGIGLDLASLMFTQAGVGAVARSAQLKMRENVSVFDFMTSAQIADVEAGTTLVDVTAAIQSALTYVASSGISGPTTSGALTTSYSGTVPRLRFPKGVYKITAALTVGSYIEIVGDSAILKQFTDTEDIFICEAYQFKIEGVQFVGGRYQIDFYNQNINSAMVDINQCQFFLSRSYAVNSRSTHATFTHLSTSLNIRECRFIACNKILNNVCDQASISESWLQMDKNNFTASTAAIKNKGKSVADPDAITRLHIRDSFLIPDVGTEGVDRVKNVRWIDNYGSFTATHSRFGGEFGGMSILWHLGAPNVNSFPWNVTEVIFKECALFAGPDARADSCVIGIQGEIPNRVVIRNCFGPVGRPLIANLSSLNIPTYLLNYETASGKKAREYFKIDIQDVITDVNAYVPTRTVIPNDLYPYAVKGKQARVRRAAAQSLSNAFVNNLVSCDTVEFDNVGAFDIANPTRIVMPKGCTKMRILVNMQLAVDGAEKTVAATIVTSGIVRLGGDTSLRGINADSDRICISVDVSGAPDEYWHVNIQHNAAAALNLLDCRISVTPLDFIL